jgi:hypothetical protein
MFTKSIAFAAVALSALSGTAQAAITVYTSQASFLAAVTSPGVDTFTGFSISGSTPSPIARTAGSYGYTAAVSTTSFFGAGTTGNPWLSTNTATDTITFSGFTGGANAIGGNFFDSDILGNFAAGSITLVASDTGGTSSYTITGATTGSFLGFTSTTGITGLTVAAVQPATPIWPTVDNLTLAITNAAPAVPEPASWAMMIAGFGLVGGAMRRRQTTVVAFG